MVEAVEGSHRPVRAERENAIVRKASLRGADNFFVDLGSGNAEALSAKAALAFKLNAFVACSGLSQMQAAPITGMPLSKLFQVRRY